jgi:hypothetical protein
MNADPTTKVRYMVRFTNAIMNILLHNLKLKIQKVLLNLITNIILTFLG